jgi:transcriptional regulator with XRE-family HTH domain
MRYTGRQEVFKMDMKQTGKHIAALRKANGYTQEALAEKLGISPQAVSKWETGAGLPEASLLVELSGLLRVSVDDILQPGKNSVAAFMNRNLAAPHQKLLEGIPKISRWDPPPGCDMPYSMPAMIAEALCCIEAYEKGGSVTMEALNERFRDLMHVMGVGYGFLWYEKRHLAEELWRINDLGDMAGRAMRYYGRDYLWLTGANASPEEMRRAVVWSVDRRHPVVMEQAGGIPEFSIVTGYEDNGNTLIGWTYCGECAAKTNGQGMFVNPARWGEDRDFHILVIGDSVPPTYSDRDSIEYALEVLDRKEPQDRAAVDPEWCVAGDAALRLWLEACDTDAHTIELFKVSDIHTWALELNSIYAQKCLLPYFRKLGERSNAKVYGTVIQIGIAIDIIERERKGLGNYKKKPKEHAAACRAHIENLIKHREYMRGWLRMIAEEL